MDKAEVAFKTVTSDAFDWVVVSGSASPPWASDLGKSRMNLPEMGEKRSARDTETLEPGSRWPSAPTGPLPPLVLSATTVLLQGLKAISSSEMETAQVGYDNQEDNLEGCLQAP